MQPVPDNQDAAAATCIIIANALVSMQSFEGIMPASTEHHQKHQA
jgi:hypothetical protein